jgi:hypothetical protein
MRARSEYDHHRLLASDHAKTSPNCSQGSNGWVGLISREKNRDAGALGIELGRPSVAENWLKP